MENAEPPEESKSRYSMRRWWMFLPLLLTAGALFYCNYHSDPEPDFPGEWSIEPVPFAENIPAARPETQSPVPEAVSVEKVLRQNDFFHREMILALLSYRLPDVQSLRVLYPETGDILADFRLIPEKILRQRQDFWLRSHAVSISAQQQMLQEDPVMQYAALGLIIDGVFVRIGNSGHPAQKDLDELGELIRLQNSLDLTSADQH